MSNKGYLAMLTTLLQLLSAGVVTAQIHEGDTLRFQVRSALTGSYQTGNVDLLAIRGKLDAVVKCTPDVVFKSQNNQLYQAFYGKKADNDMFSRNYLYYKPHQKVYPYAMAYLSTNFRRKVQLRYFVGGGATYQLIHNKSTVLKLSANAVYEQSRFSAQTFNDTYYNGSDQITVWRASVFTYGSTRLFHRRMRVYYDAFWQPAFRRSNNYRTQVDLGVELPVWKGLSFNAVFAYTRENVVPTGTVTTDQLLSFGVSYYFALATSTTNR